MGICVVPHPPPSIPGSWFTPPTSSVTRTAQAQPRSTREPRATTTPVRRSSPSWRWVLTFRVSGLLQPRGCHSGSRSGREWFPARQQPRSPSVHALPRPLPAPQIYLCQVSHKRLETHSVRKYPKESVHSTRKNGQKETSSRNKPTKKWLKELRKMPKPMSVQRQLQDETD